MQREKLKKYFNITLIALSIVGGVVLWVANIPPEVSAAGTFAIISAGIAQVSRLLAASGDKLIDAIADEDKK